MNNSKPELSKVQKIIGSLILLVPSGLVIFLHNWVNLLGGGFRTLRFKVASSEDLVDAFTKQIKASENMNLIEIIIWILLPTITISLVFLFLGYPKRKRWLCLITALVFSLLFALATVTNVVGTNQKLETESSNLTERFSEAFYPGVNDYSVTYTDEFEGGHGVNISYETKDSPIMVKSFYLSKGFGERADL